MITTTQFVGALLCLGAGALYVFEDWCLTSARRARREADRMDRNTGDTASPIRSHIWRN